MTIRQFKTSQSGEERLSEVSLETGLNPVTSVKVDSSLRYQTMEGFGGAFTEAASYTLSRMSEENRAKVIDLYFNQETGLSYNIGRVHIHSCDFALENYTYVEDNDTELSSFSISRDFKWVIPLIKDAEQVRGESIRLLASPWSPPAWMKTNNEMNHGGKLKDEFKQVWANYYVKFLEEYRKAGLDMWSLTVQNEPAAVQIWDSCIYSAEEERDFIKYYLGPTLKQSSVKDVLLYIWDHNRDIVVERASTVLSDPEAAKYVYGTGIHWYVSEEFEKVGKVHDLFPDKHILFTEGCQEGGVHLGAWHTGERYGRNMIGDFNNWCEGYIDWNIVLDETGGPNHVNNLCDAPIICDTRTDEVHVNSSYYYIGHFSKFVPKGSKRIDVQVSNESLLSTGFITPMNDIVLVVQNQTDESIEFTLELDGVNTVLSSDMHSISTYIIK